MTTATSSSGTDLAKADAMKLAKTGDKGDAISADTFPPWVRGAAFVNVDLEGEKGEVKV
jgi:hypothetical protein